MGKAIIKDAQGCPMHWVEDSGTQVSSSRYLLHAAAVYLIIIVTLWCVPACLYHRISDTGQAVVLTLVNTAASELQSLADPEIVSDFTSSSLSNNLTLSSSASKGTQQTVDPVTDTEINIVVSSKQVNDSVTSETQMTEDLEEDSETVVVVRAEKKSVVEEVRIDEEIKSEEEVLSKEEFLKEKDYNPALELNDSAARAQLVEGTNDDSVAVILDSIAVSGSSDAHEDMPSFSEWAQKRLEEAEKKKSHPNVSVQNPGSPGKNVGGMKMRSKNYASPDCGAKIVAANPESRSARNVLVSTRDEYMLNTCTSRIWFVVELCEAIQAKKIELANFELFSSSPKDFSVYVSDRFPSRDWSSVGHFTAKDERDIQSFALQPHLFGKFIKIELHSHYGSEHFCPVSLFRAYGTSEFEVLETETEVQAPTSDDEDGENENGEDLLDFEGVEPTRNLFGSARDAVLSIVRKAAEVLVKTGDMSRNNITKIQESIREDLFQSSFTSCTSPRYAIICRNCTDDRFARVFQLLSCRHRYLEVLLNTSFISNVLRHSHLCSIYEQKLNNDSIETVTCRAWDLQATFLASVFTPDYIVALCNVLAVKDGKVVLNSSDEITPIPENGTLKEEIFEFQEEKRDYSIESAQTRATPICSLDMSSTSCKPTTTVQESRRRNSETSGKETESTMVTLSEISSSSEILASQIKPTKTLNKEEVKKESPVPILEPSKDQMEESSHPEILISPSPLTNAASLTVTTQEESSLQAESFARVDDHFQTSLVLNNEQEKQQIQEKEGDAQIQEIQESKFVDARSEKLDQDVKQNKTDLGEDVKILSQEQINFDSLLSDFKEFEGEVVNSGQGGSFSVAQPSTISTPQQKESVFLRLSNRIKALERNMSLSGQYLEELSRRYKKQVEEMQRSLERAISAMSEESRKGEERDSRRMEEIANLREEVKFLSKSVESLLYDRDSWQTKLLNLGQHFILICMNVIVVIFIISYYRRNVEYDEQEGELETAESNKTIDRKVTDLFKDKSVTSFSHLSKKPKKRRQSEITHNTSGTFEELMIEDQILTLNSKKERKKKRKKEMLRILREDSKNEAVHCKGNFNALPNSLPSRRASSNDASIVSKDFMNSNERRSDSVLENFASWTKENMNNRIEISSAAKEGDVAQDNSSFQTKIHFPIKVTPVSSNDVENETFKKDLKTGILKSKLSSSSFMRSALVSRSKRLSSTSNGNYTSEDLYKSRFSSQESNSSLRIVSEEQVNGSATNGHAEDSDRSSIATSTSRKKEKKSTGLKNMVRKLF